MRRWILICLLLLVPCLARANPIKVDPGGLSEFWGVAFTALTVESAVVAAVLSFTGVSAFRFFVLYFVANFAVFLCVFVPLMRLTDAPLMAESVVVVADAVAIKLLGKVAALQGPKYRTIALWLALTVSVLGNTASFSIGWLMASVD